jgi:hypothetical protein
MTSRFRLAHGRAMNAACADYAPEYPVVHRTVLQQRLRAVIRENILEAFEKAFRTHRLARADAYARTRVDALDYTLVMDAVYAAIQESLVPVTMSAEERRAIEAEHRYERVRGMRRLH